MQAKKIADKPVGLIIENKDKKNLDAILGVNFTEEKDKLALRYVATALAQDQEFITMALQDSENKDWKKMPTGEFLKHFFEYTALGSLTTLADSIKNFNWTDGEEGIKNQMK